jgi:hypothetical protein
MAAIRFVSVVLAPFLFGFCLVSCMQNDSVPSLYLQAGMGNVVLEGCSTTTDASEPTVEQPTGECR